VTLLTLLLVIPDLVSGIHGSTAARLLRQAARAACFHGQAAEIWIPDTRSGMTSVEESERWVTL